MASSYRKQFESIKAQCIAAGFNGFDVYFAGGGGRGDVERICAHIKNRPYVINDGGPWENQYKTLVTDIKNFVMRLAMEKDQDWTQDDGGQGELQVMFDTDIFYFYIDINVLASETVYEAGGIDALEDEE